MKRLLLLTLLIGCSLQAQSFYNWTSNGTQTAVSPGVTNWAAGQGSCSAPWVGPGGWRTIGGSMRLYSTCSFPTIELLDARIFQNPYDPFIAQWEDHAIGSLSGQTGHIYSAWQECSYPDGTGNYTGIMGVYEQDYGCQY